MPCMRFMVSHRPRGRYHPGRDAHEGQGGTDGRIESRIDIVVLKGENPPGDLGE
jgi:hypothetical protein